MTPIPDILTAANPPDKEFEKSEPDAVTDEEFCDVVHVVLPSIKKSLVPKPVINTAWDWLVIRAIARLKIASLVCLLKLFIFKSLVFINSRKV